IGADDRAAVGLADRLVAEAHAERRNGRAPPPNRIDGHAGLGRRARPGRNDNRRRRQLPDLVDGDGVVPTDGRLGPQLAEILHEVVGERVVVVDDEEHACQYTAGPGTAPLKGPTRAGETAGAPGADT